MPEIRCLLASLFLTCAVLIPSASHANEPVLLRYRFEPGQIVRYEVDLRDNYKIQIQNARDDQHSYQTSQKSYRVKSVLPDGSAVLELVTIEWIAVDILQNGETFKFDSRSEEKQENPIFAAMERMVGKPMMELTISPTGEITNFAPLLNPDTPKEAISAHALDALVKLPEEAQAIGSRWTEDLTVDVSLTGSDTLKRPIKIQREYFLTDITDGLATIKLKTRILSPMNDPDEELQLIRRAPQGTIVLDLNRGILVSQTMTQDKEVTGFGGTQQSVMSFKQQLTEKLVEKQAAAPNAGAATR